MFGRVVIIVVRTTLIVDEEGTIKNIIPKAKPDTNTTEILAEL